MKRPIILWFRRDLRLADHPALHAACETGRPVIPLYILDELGESLGAAPKYRLGLGIGAFSQSLEKMGSRLVLRRGRAFDVLRALIEETGARSVYWSRLYDPASVARDTETKSKLKAAGIEARSFGGHLLFEPWSVTTKDGGFYKVFSPFWKAVEPRCVDTPLPAPDRVPSPEVWPRSAQLDDWEMGKAMQRGAAVLRPYVRLGEAAALERLDHFVSDAIGQYSARRDFPAVDATSGLSENLALGEISPHRCWHSGLRALHSGKSQAQVFLKELVWREFAYHLMHHTPHILDQNWRKGWNSFPWNTEADHPNVLAWQKGLTGIPFVDAGMRELCVTGRMHNRARMIVASYLTKHLMSHWTIGKRWFEDCLIDWDPASNAMGWQWAAGCGPDAAPYFRVFNPATQLKKFDPSHDYVRRWIAEGQRSPGDEALAYFAAVPRAWKLDRMQPYPAPVVDLAEGRKLALDAYAARDF